MKSILTALLIVAGVVTAAAQNLQRSELTVFVNSFGVRANNVRDEGSAHVADFESDISIALTNNGNAPASLLKVFYAAPRSADAECETVRHLDWDLFGPVAFGAGGLIAHAFSIEPLTVLPGKTVTATGEMKFKDAAREKTAEYKSMCLLFIALNHEGTVFVKSITGTKLGMGPNGSSTQFSDGKGKSLNLTE